MRKSRTLIYVIYAAVLAVTVYSSNISKVNNRQPLNFEGIRLRAEAFYQTLPPTLREDATLKVPELIKKYGYPAETHLITTKDGYILTIHRIPNGKKHRSTNRPVMLLEHGLLSSSADWVVAGPEKSLGYILADSGFDVWMGNARGTKYSRNHMSLNPNSDQFWQFSWHEIALYDLPPVIDYILAKTKREKLNYIGHSQGTTIFFVLCSQKPEYNNKIQMQFSLAPVAYMSHMTSPLLRMIVPVSGGMETVADLLGVNEFNPIPELTMEMGNLLCNDDSITQILCTNYIFLLLGYNPKQMNASLLPSILGHSPAGASTRQIWHYGQEVNSGRFEYFDYGPIRNLVEYGFVSPPQYDLSNIKVPVYLFYSRNDWMSHEVDVLPLCRELGNCKSKILITDKQFNHLDYLYAIEAPDLVYKKLIAIATKH